MLDGADGADSIDGGSGDDLIAGGAGGDSIQGGDGNDTIHASGDIDPATGLVTQEEDSSGLRDAVAAQGGYDVIDGGAGDDTIIGSSNEDTLFGGSGNDLIEGRGSQDQLFGGADNDTVRGEEGDDRIDGGTGNDVLYGGASQDSISGGDGRDLVQGDDGDDRLSGGADADILTGGQGQDSIAGDAGDDTITGGSGDDRLFGGDDQDRFVHGANDGRDTVDGGSGGVDFDTLDLSSLPRSRFRIEDLTTDSDGNGFDGRVVVLDGNGATVGSIAFENIENIIPCFTPGTMIATARGEVAVEALRTGDRVMTRDNGYQAIRWIGSKPLTHTELLADPSLQPVLIRKDALGPGLPDRDMMVSPQHRMLLTGGRADLLFGETEMLARAIHLADLPGITRCSLSGVTYKHVLFDQHEIIRANNTWTESFQPGDRTIGGMEDDVREELFKLFPELVHRNAGTYPSARPTLKAYETRLMLAA
jgi:hypothetical protein